MYEIFVFEGAGVCAVTTQFTGFFSFSCFLLSSLIFNKKVRSKASSRMLSGQAELLKTAHPECFRDPLLRT